MNTRSILVLMVLATAGCDSGKTANRPAAPSTATTGDSPMSTESSTPPILAPFAGQWKFSLPKTLTRWQADGIPADEIDEAKMFAKEFPLHPDMRFENDVAVLYPGDAEGEYKFFALHPHGPWVCGKTWHHEDR